ncbi:serine protease 76 isoform X1 [Nasonia vitripennis]|uniref:CLIP domain-containing serine protease n=1 Tax=Nasonia vitripennis TaxID=7425 RepID=A0A7M7IP65_NASVI|nr:serine protease 76 isoform X1 [Nasonia vitripennis]
MFERYVYTVYVYLQYILDQCVCFVVPYLLSSTIYVLTSALFFTHHLKVSTWKQDSFEAHILHFFFLCRNVTMMYIANTLQLSQLLIYRPISDSYKKSSRHARSLSVAFLIPAATRVKNFQDTKMGVKLKANNSVLLLCVISVLSFQLVFAQADESPKNSTSRTGLCLSPSGSLGLCIRLNYCKPLLDFFNQNPEYAEQVVYSYLCPGGNRGFVVCCPLSTNQIQSPKPTDTTSAASPVNNNGDSKVQPLTPPRCGRSSANHDRVVGGNPAELGAWPWIGLLGYGSRNSNQVGFRCGGTLVSSRTVVTAAHCVHDQNDLKVVRLGEQNLRQTDGAVVDYPIQKKIVHPNYEPDTSENDIALLILDEDVQFTDRIRPICLPVSDDLRKRDFVRNFPFVAGWGRTQFGGSGSSVLLEAQVPVVDAATCKAQYRSVMNTVIDNRVICAGYPQGGKDACQGDSGGPLMFPVKNNYYLIGVVSGGYKCAEPGFSGIYTRVTSFLDFILNNLQ